MRKKEKESMEDAVDRIEQLLINREYTLYKRLRAVELSISTLKEEIKQITCNHPLEKRVFDRITSYSLGTQSVQQCSKCSKVIERYEKYSDFRSDEASWHRKMAKKLTEEVKKKPLK